MDRRLWAAYAEEEAYDTPRQLWRRRVLTANAFGLRASKFVQYDVLSPPFNAISISKLVQYNVLGPVPGVSASKFVQYVVLRSLPLPPSPPRVLRLQFTTIEDLDVGYEDVPNLNLRRRVQTPDAAYFVTPPPVSAKPSGARQDTVSQEDDPLNLNVLMRRVTPFGANSFAQPQSASDINLRIGHLMSAYALDDDTDTYLSVLRRRTGAATISPLVPAGSPYVPVMIMA